MAEEKETKSVEIPKTSKIEDVSMSNADNGVIISYCERTPRPASKGTYDMCMDYNRRQEVYDFDDETDETEAFDRYRELFIRARADRNKKS